MVETVIIPAEHWARWPSEEEIDRAVHQAFAKQGLVPAAFLKREIVGSIMALLQDRKK